MGNILTAAKNIGIKHNVSLRVIDAYSGKVIQTHTGHNAATNSMLTGMGYYLIGNGVLNQGATLLSNYIPKYISLGTMGLLTQAEDDDGLPDFGTGEDEIKACTAYMDTTPGYGADGYDGNLNNNRLYFGLGPMYANRNTDITTDAVDCELISNSFPRVSITYRDVIPETEAEVPESIDVVYSAMISTGALAQFRGDNDYIFITEAGLWSQKNWNSESTVGENGLLAGYRIVPPNSNEWYMSPDDVPDDLAEQEQEPGESLLETKTRLATANRLALRQQILRVGKNQVVQVIWKLQLGAIKQLVGADKSVFSWDLIWRNVDGTIIEDMNTEE